MKNMKLPTKKQVAAAKKELKKREFDIRLHSLGLLAKIWLGV